MTITATAARQQHNGNGVTTSFSTGFSFKSNDQVRVIFTSGSDTDWVEGTHYTLTGADTGAAGTVTVKTSPTDYTPATGTKLTILLDVDFEQSLDANTLSAFSGESLEDALDEIWLGLKQLKEMSARAVTSSETGDGTAEIAGWSPILAVKTDGTRRVLQVADWTGGTEDKPDTGDYIGSTGLTATIGDAVDVRGPAGPTGAGTGDLLAASNLSDVADAATAFANIKQGATTSATGVVELATDAEAQAQADTARAITPSNLAAVTATTTRSGLAELATDAEAIAKADTGRTLTPSNLAALGGTDTFAGLLELATPAEAVTGTDTARAVTPEGVAAAIAASEPTFQAGMVLQTLQTTYATATALTTVIPLDDSTPTSSEGTQVLSQAITPSETSSKVRVQAQLNGCVKDSADTPPSEFVAALFRGTTCIDAKAVYAPNYPNMEFLAFDILDSPASASATTYSVRVGPGTSGDEVLLNGARVSDVSAGRRFGGTAKCTLTLQEIKG